MASEHKPWKSKLLEVLHKTPYFRTLRQSVDLPDGTQAEYFTIDFPGPAVGIIARRNDRYLLIRQYRFIVNEFVWAIPSGGVEAGENPEHAALRELEEETGYRSGSAREILRYYPSYGCGNQEFILFETDEVDELPSGDFDRREVLDVKWFERDEIIEMVINNRIVDGLSLTPLAVLLLAESQGQSPRSRRTDD